MAGKEKQKTPEPIELVEAIPEGLGGEEAGAEAAAVGSTYVPALRAGMALEQPGPSALDMTGIRPPYLSLVHGTSKDLLEKFNQGDLVLSKDFAAARKGEAMPAIILGIDQFWKERVTQDQWNDGRRPRIFRNKEEAREAGLRVDWEGDIGPDAGPAMDVLLLIRKPKDRECGLYGVDIGIMDGGNPTEWAICLMSFDKTGYRVMANDTFNTIRFKLGKSGTYSALWEFRTELGAPAKKTGNRPFVVRAKFTGMLDPMVVANIRNVMSVPVTAREPGEEG